MNNLVVYRQLAFLIVFAYGTLAPAAPPAALIAPPEDLVRRVRETLPAGWTATIEASRITVRPHQLPEFVNLVSAMRQGPTESREAYLDRHSVEFDYQIVLHVAPRMTAEQFAQLVAADHNARRRIDELEHHLAARPGKGSVHFPDTPEGRALDQEYEQLRASLRPLPNGYFGSATVTVEPTQTGYATFRHETDREKCHKVIQSLQQLLTPYAATADKPSP